MIVYFKFAIMQRSGLATGGHLKELSCPLTANVIKRTAVSNLTAPPACSKPPVIHRAYNFTILN